MNARDDILSAIRGGRVKNSPRPLVYRGPDVPDLLTTFVERARSANAEVRVLSCDADVPVAVAQLLRARNQPAVVHIPRDDNSELPWHLASGLSLTRSPPGS